LKEKTISPVFTADFAQTDPRLSPDSRWLAYVSSESGSEQVYLRNWPELNNKWQVSQQGGRNPHWSQDGTELIFEALRSRETHVSQVDVVNGEPIVSVPQVLTSWELGVRHVAFTDDHQQYLLGKSVSIAEITPIKVLVNWKLGSR